MAVILLVKLNECRVSVFTNRPGLEMHEGLHQKMSNMKDEELSVPKYFYSGNTQTKLSIT